MKTSPGSFDGELTEALDRVARLWYESTHRPFIDANVLNRWDDLLLSWVKDKTLPLIIRSAKGLPGSEVTHCCGRLLIPSDNSPASWAFTLAERGEIPTIDQLREWLGADGIPFALAIKAAHKPHTKYLCNLARTRDNPNLRGWKVAHVVPVGMNLSGALCDYPEAVLETHFINLMSPGNM